MELRCFSIRSAFLIALPLLFLLLPAGDSSADIAVDNTSSSSGSTSPLTWAHTVNSNANGILIVGVSTNNKDRTVSGVTYGGLAMTLIGQIASTEKMAVRMYYRLLPPTGTNNVVVTLSGGTPVVGGAISFTGVNQSAPLGIFAGALGRSATPTVAASSGADNVVVDTVAVETLATISSPGTGQTSRWSNANGSGSDGVRGAGSTEAGAASVTMSWNLSTTAYWAIGAVSVNAQPPYRPDAMIRNNGEGDGSYLTDNVYETTASVQVKSQSVVNGTAAVYVIRFQNDSASADSLKMAPGTATGSGFTVQYLDNSSIDRTSAVTGAGYDIPTLASGASTVWTLRVTPGASVTGGTSHPVSVSATSAGDNAARDQVRATTTSSSANLTLLKSADKGSYIPGEEIVYTVTAANGSGLTNASAVVVTDNVPAHAGFKVGGATFSQGSSTLSAAIGYSSNGGATYAYTPVGGGCSAPAGYDYCVTHVRWTMTGNMPTGSSFGVGLVVRVR